MRITAGNHFHQYHLSIFDLKNSGGVILMQSSECPNLRLIANALEKTPQNQGVLLLYPLNTWGMIWIVLEGKLLLKAIKVSDSSSLQAVFHKALNWWHLWWIDLFSRCSRSWDSMMPVIREEPFIIVDLIVQCQIKSLHVEKSKYVLYTFIKYERAYMSMDV